MEENTNIVETVETDIGNSYGSYETETETTETLETSETNNVEDSTPKGEKSTKFADYRRREELERYRTEVGEYKQKTSDYEQQIADYKDREQRLNDLLSNYYDGDDINSKMLAMEAQIKGVSVDDLQAEIDRNNAEQQAIKERDDELAYYKGIAEQVQREKAISMYDADLKTIQAIDPYVKSLEELGEEFTKLRFTVNPLTGECYSATDIYNHLKEKIRPMPQTSGNINTTAEEKQELNFATMPDAEFEKWFNKVVNGG